MISLTCTNCRAVLEIDDAFAGGVCRCQTCGAIQTVPSRLKQVAASGKAGPKTLYTRPARGEAVPSSGLDELAQIVASSGLSSGRLRAKAPPAAPAKQAPSRGRALLIGGGALVALAIGAGIWMALPAQKDSGRATGLGGATDVAVQRSLASAGATFCGVPLDDRVVIYVLDRGSGTADLFSYLKEVALKSAESLGNDRKFQIIFWNNGTDDAYPSAGPTYATAQNLEAARRALDGIYAHGQTDVASALSKAVSAAPDAIVLATGKGWQLDDGFVDQVLKIRKGRPIKIHTFALGGTEPSAILASIAQRTGGESRLVKDGELKQAAKE